MLNLRKFARGKPCQVRIVGVCSFDDSETVLAHIRLGGVGGTGMKPPDLCGVHACLNCHREIDLHTSNMTQLERESYILHGLLRTLREVSRELEWD